MVARNISNNSVFRRHVKASIAKKERELSKIHLQSFIACSDQFVNNFEEFKAAGKHKSETFECWDTFTPKMVSLLKDLIQADREGNWNLHLQTVQACLPVFVLFDCTNYLCWCFLYLEDMRQLPETTPELHRNFLAGKFVVKQNPGLFRAVGADICLEQTIDRSQKATAGIIGSIRRKQFVDQWEIIYHEMSAVSSLQRIVSAASLSHGEVTINHEFNTSETISIEKKVTDMITYIESHENPSCLSSITKLKLHNILTQEIMTEEIRKDLSHVQKIRSDLYSTFREERFIKRMKRLSDTIYRNNLKTFTSIRTEKKAIKSKKKEKKKESVQAQKLMELARVRGFDTKELFKYDLFSSI